MAERRFSSVPDAVRTTTSQWGAASRSRGRAVRPSTPGIERSSRTRSGWSRPASTIASAPSDAQPITFRPWAPRSDERASLVRGWSSTIRILAGMRGSYRQEAFCRQEGGEIRRKERKAELALGRDPARRTARGQPGPVRLPPLASHALRPSRAPPRPADDDDPGRPARRRAGGGALCGGGPPCRPAARERLLRHLAVERGLCDRPSVRGPRRRAAGGLVGAHRRHPRHGADRRCTAQPRTQQVPRLGDRERRRRCGHHALRRVVAYAVMLVGAWRAIQFAEFGRAVAEERARVAREIHDGLAQYLFAVSTHTSMLESGAPIEETVPRLKAAAVLAQQEARFAILALSSASGTAPFDAALRRYVDFLVADGGLEVVLRT